MDDRTVTPDDELIPEERPEPPADAPFAPRRRGVGGAAGLVLGGLLLGLGIGWIAWRAASSDDAPTASIREVALDGERTIVEGVDVTNDPVLGPADAPVTIVEFSDFECPFCSRFAKNTAPLLRRQYGDNLRWIFVNTPLRSIHPRAYDAALAGECAAAQGKFWEFYDAAFSGRHGLSDGDLEAIGGEIGVDEEAYGTCYDEATYAVEVAADEKEAQKFYILGTPSFYINGRRLEGAQPPEVFAAVIDSILLSRS